MWVVHRPHCSLGFLATHARKCKHTFSKRHVVEGAFGAVAVFALHLRCMVSIARAVKRLEGSEEEEERSAEGENGLRRIGWSSVGSGVVWGVGWCYKLPQMVTLPTMAFAAYYGARCGTRCLSWRLLGDASGEELAANDGEGRAARVAEDATEGHADQICARREVPIL